MSETDYAEAIRQEFEELSPTEEFIRAARRMQEHEQLDPWELGDKAIEAVKQKYAEKYQGDPGKLETALAAVFPPQAAGRPEETRSTARTGHRQLLEELNLEMRQAGVLEIEDRTVRNSFDTARAWPPDERLSEKAAFDAHRALNAKKWDGRRRAKLLKLAGQSKHGWVTRARVRLDISEATPRKPPSSREEVLEKGVVGALTRWSSPQKFQQLAVEERKYAAGLLKRLAFEIESGGFDA